MKLFLRWVVPLGLLSCSSPGSGDTTVYLSGEINHPTDGYVVLWRDDQVVDSAKLDAANRFHFRMDSITEGIHHFVHYPENQYIYLEPGDSTSFRLDTRTFDETLVFMGSNMDVNNFLIDVFLENEERESYIGESYRLEPEVFRKRIDSLRKAQLKRLDRLRDKDGMTDAAFEIGKAAVDYYSFIHMEKYPFYHRMGRYAETFQKLDEDFYSYREELDLEQAELAYFKPYYDFMKVHYGNLTYRECGEACSPAAIRNTKDHLHMYHQKMALIDESVRDSELRDNLLRNVAMDYLLKVHKVDTDCDAFIDDYRNRSDNPAHVAEIKDLYHGIERLQPNGSLPSVAVQNHYGDTLDLRQVPVPGKRTVFYFWTGVQDRHFAKTMQHLGTLRANHPDTDFIGLSLQTEPGLWKKLGEEHGVKWSDQYRALDFDELRRALIVNSLNKCVIVEDTIIVDAFANLYHPLAETDGAWVRNEPSKEANRALR